MLCTARDVLINEVGLRDGLQIIKTILPTIEKQLWCAEAAAAGIAEMEVTSLVPSRLIAQFYDAGAIIAHAKSIPGLTASALVPNLKGAERAISLGLRKFTYIVSVSESFNRANVRQSIQASIADLQVIVTLINSLPRSARPTIVGGLSSVFGCGIEGRVPVASILSVAEAMIEAGVDELAVADTTGAGDPALVRSVIPALTALAPNTPLSAHFHDTRGTGLANVLAALDCGIRRFDSSLGGIGGCPNSPGARGNIATEDLVFMLEAMGLRTGVDLEALLRLRRDVATLLPDVDFYGNLSRSGLPAGFRDAAAQRREVATEH